VRRLLPFLAACSGAATGPAATVDNAGTDAPLRLQLLAEGDRFTAELIAGMQAATLDQGWIAVTGERPDVVVRSEMTGGESTTTSYSCSLAIWLDGEEKLTGGAGGATGGGSHGRDHADPHVLLAGCVRDRAESMFEEDVMPILRRRAKRAR
jgi:hypothetical protein